MDHNIVFQVLDHTQKNPTWHNSKIVYVLGLAPSDYHVTAIVDAISAVLGSCTVRFARLNPDEKIDLETANKHDGVFYTHHNPG